jgi:hypothetical protein
MSVLALSMLAMSVLAMSAVEGSKLTALHILMPAILVFA